MTSGPFFIALLKIPKAPDRECPLRENNMSDTPTIRLDQFLKLADVVQSGGEAKLLIQSGGVMVNGVVETRRKRQLQPGDEVHVGDLVMEVSLDD